jgi:hypothetical protein
MLSSLRPSARLAALLDPPAKAALMAALRVHAETGHCRPVRYQHPA